MALYSKQLLVLYMLLYPFPQQHPTAECRHGGVGVLKTIWAGGGRGAALFIVATTRQHDNATTRQRDNALRLLYDNAKIRKMLAPRGQKMKFCDAFIGNMTNDNLLCSKRCSYCRNRCRACPALPRDDFCQNKFVVALTI